uniref:NADH-ubiquinone oxidoreductase chain 3 n=1 Tax=Robertsicus elaphensis TaxID=2599317 RepID=H9M753_9ACAR|nr:NADH dehydrogenase subunit 3 [Robertsicus elaphensis]AET63070.1 NADH dehydrogenase subunit 3 [Robertsicus elaphensis]
MLSKILMMTMLILMFLFFFFMKFKNILSKHKFSPFECGLDPFSSSRVPFSLKFFIIGIIFLVFDIEIILIIPFPILVLNKNFSIFFSFFLINLLMLLGLIYEWKMGMIDWLK